MSGDLERDALTWLGYALGDLEAARSQPGRHVRPRIVAFNAQQAAEKALKAAYVQLLGYKDDLGNPPLLVTSDLERIEIRTNFTSLSPVVKVVKLDDLAADDPSAALALPRDLYPRSSAPGSSPPRSRRRRPSTSPRSPRAFAPAATTQRRSPTSWSARCRLLDGDP